MDLPIAMLNLREAPLDLGIVLLILSFQRPYCLDHARDFDLLSVLGVGPFEKAVSDRLFAAATTAAVWQAELHVQDQSAEDAPVHVLVLVDARFFVDNFADIHGHFLA